MEEDFERRYRAVCARDARFDGWFFTAVASTGIYCRPSCPARTPLRTNVRFYPSAAAAQRAGFRACLRCRPDASPGSPEWDRRADVCGRAMRLIADGVVDRDGVSGLARQLGYGPRHLHRLLVAEVGAGPEALARAQRVQTVRMLLERTDLPVADVAFAAGFSSVRQCNETVRTLLGRPPTALRRHRAASPGRGGAGHDGAECGAAPIDLRLPYRQPLAAAPLLAFLGARAIPGVERATATGALVRSLRLPYGDGTVVLAAGDGHVRARLVLADLRDLAAAVYRCKRLLDLDADPQAVDAVLAEDPALAPLVRAVPGRRVPGAVDGVELAVRAIVGQQVSVAAARTVAGRLVAACGPRLAVPEPRPPQDGRVHRATVPARTRPPIAASPTIPAAIDRVFPSASELLEAAESAFAMPARRRASVRALASAVAAGRLTLDPGADRQATRARLVELPGIGPWTADYIVMRALGDPDAFLPTDLGVLRGLERLDGGTTPVAAERRSARWRPWRAYAMAHLWASQPTGPTSRPSPDRSPQEPAA